MIPENRLFKYVKTENAESILRDGTIYFSSPLYFNDPFDISIQTLFAYDPYDFEKFLDEFVSLSTTAEALPESNGDESTEKFLLMNSVLSKLPKSEADKIRRQLLPKDIWNEQKLRETGEQSLFEIKTAFEVSGIFCASKRYDNYLLWAHYAQEHQGAVLEFVPNLEKDSILKLAEEVHYSNVRPHLYESHRDFIMKGLFGQSVDVLRDFAKRITTTKSLEWAYEEELRIYKPLCVNIFEGKRGSIQYYHDDELRGVYLGCKMAKDKKLNLIDLAVRRNPDVKVFEMIPDPHHYRLDANRIR